jgi:hypothetical protein
LNRAPQQPAPAPAPPQYIVVEASDNESEDEVCAPAHRLQAEAPDSPDLLAAPDVDPWDEAVC